MASHVVNGISGDARDSRIGQLAFITAALTLVALGLAVVWRGAPLSDDFHNCVAPIQLGLRGFLAASWDRLGLVRPARFLEILLTTGICRSAPFGIAIAVPLILTLTVASLLRGLLRDLQTPPLWADLGGALWLLQPLGTESALWPAALHVPLGLVLCLSALRFYHRASYRWAALATLGAAWSVEQVILALPVAALLVTPFRNRRRAFITACGVVLAVLVGFALFPGSDPRLRVGVIERLAALSDDPTFYVGFPAVGLGLHSIPMAVWWALPWSVIALAAGGIVGLAAGRRIPCGRGLTRSDAILRLMAVGVLVTLANAPVLFTVPHQGSPRVFAPTWLILVAAAAMSAGEIRWRRPSALGAAGGLFAAGAILSLALSVSVRLVSADFTERSARLLADKVRDGGQVAICGVRRTVTTPAPRGAFAIHELVYEWAAEDALAFYTGQRATFHLAGELWDRPCPNAADVDVVLTFDELLAAARR